MKLNHTSIISEADNRQTAAVGPFPVLGDCCLGRERALRRESCTLSADPPPPPFTPLICFMLTVKRLQKVKYMLILSVTLFEISFFIAWFNK